MIVNCISNTKNNPFLHHHLSDSIYKCRDYYKNNPKGNKMRHHHKRKDAGNILVPDMDHCRP
ncbi:MAG: hypothetical protein Q8N77_06300 [Nanoarchaeota archaeon]|nr:hypothetical protein [Nanoarchaeota archaeon]